MSDSDNSTLFGIVIVVLLVVILFGQIQLMGALNSFGDALKNLNITIPNSPFTPSTPPGYTPPGTLPPGFSGSGSMTSAECSQYATMNGKTNSALKSSEGNCATYASNTCHNQGMEAHYDYVSGCCVFNCEPLQQTACQTFCSSHNLQIIQTGFWTEQQCYDSAIYLCGGLLYLETDLVSPDGTCCCYLCK